MKINNFITKIKFSSFLKLGFILVYVFFIYSGSLKWITFFPIDATIFFAIPLLLILIANLRLTEAPFYKPSLSLVISFLLLILWISLTCLYTASDNYYKDKILRTVLICITFLFPLIFFKDYSYFKSFVKGTSIFASIVLLMLTVVLIVYGNLDILFYAMELEYLNLPDYLVISEILGAFVLLNHSNNSKLMLSLKFLALAYMVMLGGRGPIVFLAIIYLCFYLFKSKFNFWKVIFLILIPILFTSSLSFFEEWDFTKILFNRLTVVFEGNAFESRSDLIRISIDLIKKNFVFGIGYGGFGILALGKDLRAYPHNIFLEIFVETGIFGLLLLLFFICYFFFKIFKRLIRNKNDICTIDFSMCFLFFFLNAMKSSSFIDVRNLYALMGVIIAYYSIEHKQKYLNHRPL